MRFRCRTGHAFAVDSLESQQSAQVEAALWAALRALRGKAQLCRRMSQRNRQNQFDTLALKYEENALAVKSHAAALQRILHQNGAPEQLAA